MFSSSVLCSCILVLKHNDYLHTSITFYYKWIHENKYDSKIKFSKFHMRKLFLTFRFSVCGISEPYLFSFSQIWIANSYCELSENQFCCVLLELSWCQTMEELYLNLFHSCFALSVCWILRRMNVNDDDDAAQGCVTTRLQINLLVICNYSVWNHEDAYVFLYDFVVDCY